jgi:hypothetical protein
MWQQQLTAPSLLECYQSRQGIREQGLISLELQYEGDCFLVSEVFREVLVTVSTLQTQVAYALATKVSNRTVRNGENFQNLRVSSSQYNTRPKD